MTTIEVFESGRTAEIPSSWDEMTDIQCQEIFRLYNKCVEQKASPMEFSIRTLYLLLGLEFGGNEAAMSAVGDEAAPLYHENIFRLCDECLSFLFPGEDSPVLTLDRIENPLPAVTAGFRKLIGPSSLLQDLTFLEFRMASAALQSYNKAGGDDEMNECIAYLYRPWSFRENKAGRKVCPIRSGRFRKDMELVSRMEPWQKLMVISWFASTLNRIQSQIITIDGEDVDMSKLFSEGGGNSDGPSLGWGDLLVEIAKQQSLGTMEEVDEQPLYAVISVMWHNYKENKLYEKKIKPHKAQ